MRRVHLPRVDSTQIEAQRRWSAEPGDPSPLVVRADVQTAGTGRRGRAWQSPDGGLWFSLAFAPQRPVGDYAGLPLVAGLSIARGLESLCTLTPRIKWPNDVLVGDRKIAGVLCAHEPGDKPAPILVGIGLNANFAADALGTGLRQAATTIQDERSGRGVDLDRLFDRLVTELTGDIRTFEQSGLPPFRDVIRDRLAWRDESVRLDDAEGRFLARGRLRGIDEQGRVIIETTTGRSAFADGELSRDEASFRPAGS